MWELIFLFKNSLNCRNKGNMHQAGSYKEQLLEISKTIENVSQNPNIWKLKMVFSLISHDTNDWLSLNFDIMGNRECRYQILL